MVAGHVVEATLDELHPDEPLHVEAEQVGERLFSFGGQALAQLSNFVVLQKVPKKGVSRLAHAVKLEVSQHASTLSLKQKIQCES